MASADNKLALQCHNDAKLIRYGLSDLKSHWNRLQIIFSSGNPNNNSTPANSNWVVPDLSPYFSNTIFWDYSDSFKGFYNVFSDIFDQVYENELSFAEKRGLGVDNSVEEAPMMGNYDSPYAQAEEFYDYWLRFSTVMDYCWVDKYDPTAEELTRKSRRVMEKENRKLRKKAQREFNMTVRSLAEFVKKRDQRVIDMLEEKRLEMEEKREVERQKEMSRKMERDQKLERAMEYEEPEWARIVEQDHEEEEEEAAFEEEELEGRERNDELYWCVVCKKKFKSENQWKNHEQSKKHREKAVAPRLRDELNEECKNTGRRMEKEQLDEECKNTGRRMEKEQSNTRRLVLDISVIHTVLLIAASLLLYISLRSIVH